MKLSHGTRIKHLTPVGGYGYATDRMLNSLSVLGHEVKQNDPTADVEIWFDQPHQWKWSGHAGPYRIGYHPWESTELQPGWLKHMNNTDEIWTPSPLVADWYREAGVKRPVYVYEHGVDPIWSPRSRVVEDKIRFLHVGGEAVRKGLYETVKAFRAAFGNRDDVELTLKMLAPGWNVPLRNINIIKDALPIDELVALYHSHHAYVYPSWGEGFGLTPLQALATGMPTITVPAWAPYDIELDPNISISAELVDSPWPKIHPGKMFQPNFDELVDAMRLTVDKYDILHERQQVMTASVARNYDWISLTDETFYDLECRLKSS